MNRPAPRTGSQLILEGIVTTSNVDGSVNVAPMGPVVDRKMTQFRLRPFATSTTYQNLARTQRGIFHVTDDVLLLARAAIGQLSLLPEMHRPIGVDGHVITDACRWYALEVDTMDQSLARVEVECRVVADGEQRPFFGWNRAMHSVLEAAILATRVGLLPVEEILLQLEPLGVIVDKTASDREREAFQLISEYVSQQ